MRTGQGRGRMALVAFVVFIAGVVVYGIGISTSYCTVLDWLYVLPTSVLSSLGMFLYQDDITELTDAAKGDRVFMAMYSLVHLTAACITSYIILRLVWRRLLYGLRLYWITKVRRGTKSLYVFWEINDNSIALAKDSFEHFKTMGNGERPRMVFINMLYNDESRESGFSVSNMLDVIHLSEDTHNTLTSIGAYVSNYKEGITLARLGKLVEHSASARIFILGDNEDANISNAEMFLDTFRGKERLQVYCHAKHSVCFSRETNSGRLHVIDSSHLSVMQLKQDVECQPVSVIDIDGETASATGDLQTLIIGLGETGIEAFRFLYEFGAFVDKNGKKLPYHCTIIDKKANSKSGLLAAAAPLLELDTHECEIDSKEYWHVIEKTVRGGLRYVLIAVGDDETAIDAATNLCTLATRWRNENSPQMKIFIRNNHQDRCMHMKAAISNLGKTIRGIELRMFGSTQQIFRYDIIVNDRYLNQAMEYNVAYSGNAEKVEKITDKQERNKETLRLWNKETGVTGLPVNPTMSELEEVERKQQQNISNSLHAATKIRVLEKTGIPLSKWANLDFTRENLGNEENKKFGTKYLQIEDNRQVTILHNLARLEHERWIAASILQGQQLPPEGTHKKDIVHKYHTDLVPWDDIRLFPHTNDTERTIDHLTTQGYDCAVVETSIKLKYQHRDEQLHTSTH